MRFRARTTKELLFVLLGATSSLERTSDAAVFILDDRSLRIALIADGVDAPRSFAQFEADNLFTDYRIESQSENNTIIFEVHLSQFTKALRSAKYAMQCQFKLVKRDGRACLSFETTSSEAIITVDITHDIPIRMLKADEIAYYLPPQVATPTVALELPRAKLMKTVLERMMKFSKYMQLTALQTGRITFAVENTTVAVQTFYNGLHPKFVGDLDPETSMDNVAKARVNLRKFASMLALNSLPHDSASIYIAGNSVVMLHVALAPRNVGSITTYLPVLLMDEEELDVEGNNS